jgi:hypothetical protein
MNYIILALLTAVIVDRYWKLSKAQILKDGRKERAGARRRSNPPRVQRPRAAEHLPCCAQG